MGSHSTILHNNVHFLLVWNANRKKLIFSICLLSALPKLIILQNPSYTLVLLSLRGGLTRFFFFFKDEAAILCDDLMNFSKENTSVSVQPIFMNSNAQLSSMYLACTHFAVIEMHTVFKNVYH